MRKVPAMFGIKAGLALLLAMAAAITASVDAKVTVFAYMMADNDLQCGMLNNLKQLVTGFSGMNLDSSSLPEFYIEFDNADPNSCAGSLPGIPNNHQWTTAKALTLEADPSGGAKFKVLRDYGEINSATTQQFRKFLDAGFQRYPASPDRQYFLIIADHGNGYLGVGNDHTCSSKSRFSMNNVCGPAITIPNITSTAREALKAVNLPKFDMIGFDACYMANWESLVSLQGITSYVVASEEIEPGHGWNWEVFAQLSKTPQMTVAELGKAIIAGFVDHCESAAQAHGQAAAAVCTLGLYDMAQLPELTRSLYSVSGLLGKQAELLGTDAATLTADIALSSRSTHLPTASKLVDILPFLKGLRSMQAGGSNASSSYQQGVAAVQTAMEAIKIDFQTALTSVNFSGISIHLPNLMPYALSHATEAAGRASSSSATSWEYNGIAQLHPEVRSFHDLYSALVNKTVAGSTDNSTDGVQPLKLRAAMVQLFEQGTVQVTSEVVPGDIPLMAAEQLVGFAHPLDPSKMVITDVQPAKVQGNSISSTFSLAVAVLEQELSADAKRLAVFAVKSLQEVQLGTFQATLDVLYGTSCMDSMDTMQKGVLTIAFDAQSFEVLGMVLIATDGKGGKSEIMPAAGGVIYPLLAELDPTNTSRLFMNWDFSSCLKWRYSEDIQISTGLPDEISVFPYAPPLHLLMSAATRVFGYSSADVQLLSRSQAKNSSGTQKTARGCTCADPWIDPLSGKEYSGTCASAAPPAGVAAGASKPFCIVQPGSCAVNDPLAGGDVWDTCTSTAAGAGGAAQAATTQCLPKLLDACKAAGVNQDPKTGVVTMDKSGASCSTACLAAACEASATADNCADAERVTVVTSAIFRHLDRACMALEAGASFVPTAFKCPAMLSLAPDSDSCPASGKQLLEPSGSISSSANYPAHSNCAWEIHNRQNPYITLTPESFQTEEGYDIVYVSDAFGFLGLWSGKVSSNTTLTTDSGYMLIEFRSDSSISAAGFKLRYNSSTQPKLSHSCPAGQRAVTFFVHAKESNVFDISWAVLKGAAADASASNSTVVAAGGSVPSSSEFPKAAGDVLASAAQLAESGVLYHQWRVATEVRCLAAGSYTIFPMAAGNSSWAGGTVTVAVPENATLALMRGDGGKVSFSVPEAASAAAASSVVELPKGGSFGIQAEVSFKGEGLSVEDMRGSVRGMFRTAVARMLDTVTQRVVLVDVRNGSSSAAAAGGGRRMLAVAGRAGDAGAAGAAGAAGERRLRRARVLATAAEELEMSSGSRSRSRAAAAAAAAAAVHSSGAVHSRRRLTAEISSGPGVLVSFKVIGIASAEAASAAQKALEASAKDGILLKSLVHDGLLEATSLTVDGVKVLTNVDASVSA